MRPVLFAVVFAALAQGASAQQGNVKTDPFVEPNAENSAESEALMKIQEFAKKLEEAGFLDIEIVPQAVVILAKDKFGKPVTMLLDTEAMVAVQLKTPPASETTGSG